MIGGLDKVEMQPDNLREYAYVLLVFIQISVVFFSI